MDYAITRNTTHSRVCARLLSFHPEMFGNLHFLRVCKQLGNYFCYLTIRESRLRHDLCNIELIRRRSRSDKICDSSQNNPDQARTVLTPVTTHRLDCHDYDFFFKFAELSEELALQNAKEAESEQMEMIENENDVITFKLKYLGG
jgi:hypothetical protein